MRLIATFAILMLAFGGMAVRLVVLQIVESPGYALIASKQRESTRPFPARRGSIYDRNGKSLAISVDLQTVYADPALVTDARREARRLAPLLGTPAASLQRVLEGDPQSRFEYVARQIDPALARRIENLKLAGVFARPEPKRLYPNESVASTILGFVGTDGEGLSGIENQYEGILRGRAGFMTLEQDPSGRPLPQTDFRYEPPVQGRSLYLTIDKDIQNYAELELENAIARYDANAASAVIMRPSTGEILGMANVPDFDPNRFGDFSQSDFRNRAVTDVYEPGSAYKIVTVAGAIEDDVVSPRSSFVVPDELPFEDRVFHDSHAHDTETMSVTEIIEQSSNVGTIKIGLALGGERLDHYVRRFGFGSATGLDFPGESPGIVLDRDQWSGVTIATTPIGQGIAVTTLQMASAYAALANGGVWVEPKLVSATVDGDGSLKRSSAPATRRVVSGRTARQMTEMLTGVVRRGTGMLARVPGYQVAGKTGTAQKPVAGGGYGNSYVASFAGFAPAADPEIVTIVVLDDPDPIWGGVTAAPVFRAISEYALRRLGIAPTADAQRAAEQMQSEQDLVPEPHD